MTKLIICVKSCQAHKERGDHNIIRSTWGKDAKALGIDVKFFVGSNFTRYEQDEVHVQCDDSYNGLPYKTREICKWATGKMVDFIFLADNDTFLVPRKMLQCGFENYDYVGKIDRDPKVPFEYEASSRERYLKMSTYPWASGGFGYFLSRKAFTEVAFAHPNTWAEDLWVANVLGPMTAAGEIKVLSTPSNVYSFHHPKHGEIYALEPLKNWLEQMQKIHGEHK
jgi:hypothetical protein